MDMVMMGSFLAKLRKEHNMTQAELGERLGVTNKTVSRWETGNYMPPVEMLEELSNMYELTINELLCGRRLSTEEYKEMAEANIKDTLQSSAFSVREKIEFYKKKWLKDHAVTMVFIGICIIGIMVAGVLLHKPPVVYASPVLLVVAHIWRHNTMMSYVESRVYDL